MIKMFELDDHGGEHAGYTGAVGDNRYTLQREKRFNDAWVLRLNGDYVDHDAYRFDLSERYKLNLVYKRTVEDFVVGVTVTLLSEKYYGKPIPGGERTGHSYKFSVMRGPYFTLQLVWHIKSDPHLEIKTSEHHTFSAEQVKFCGDVFKVTFGNEGQYSRLYRFN